MATKAKRPSRLRWWFRLRGQPWQPWTKRTTPRSWSGASVMAPPFDLDEGEVYEMRVGEERIMWKWARKAPR